MAVDGVGSTTSAAVTSNKTSTADKKSASLDYDSFLRLLLAQMKNQDPTEPMDASEQLSQLATFSQVEQAIKTNTHLENLITVGSLSNAASYIGKTITALDGVTNGVIASVRVASDGVTATTTTGKEIAIVEGIRISETKS